MFLVSPSKLFINQTQVADRHCRIFIVIVAVGSPKNFDRFIVVFDGSFILFEAFFAIGQVCETLPDLDCIFAFVGMLLHN